MSILSERINEGFATFMRDVEPRIAVGSPEWFTMKKGYIAGLAGGSGFSHLDEEIFFDFAADFYSACAREQQMAGMFDLVPTEHCMIAPDGQRYVTEQGMIHLATKLERQRPTDAKRIRNVRYQIQKMCQEARGMASDATERNSEEPELPDTWGQVAP